MDLLTITVIAVGLAMDAFSVSIVSGAAYRGLQIHHAFRIAVFFGAFQAVMPVIGWLGGLAFRENIQPYDHWVAFGLLLIVGCKMIWESFKFKQAEKTSDPSNLTVLLVLSVATSIDALAVGVTLSVLVTSVAMAVIIIGAVTFGLSFAGVYIGKQFGHFFENRIEIAGGIILIAIGIKIVIEHLVMNGT